MSPTQNVSILLAVTSSPRRIYLYWLLLLLPTLAVGGGSVLLLYREKARLETTAAAARDTHLAAIVGRTRLVAENADLLVGDVRDALVNSLRELAPAEEAGFFIRWPQENPLVLVGFMAGADGRLTFPEPAGGAGRNLPPRFKALLGELRPWREEAPVALGVQQGDNLPRAALSQATPSLPVQGLSLTSQTLVQQAGPGGASLANNVMVQNGNVGVNTFNNGSNFYPANGNAQQYQSQRKDLQNLSKTGLGVQRSLAVERSGWVPLEDGGAGASGVVVWLQRDRGEEVRGVVLNVATLAERLAASLPAELESGDGFALFDPTGRMMGHTGAAPAGVDPAAVVPLDAALLPGWQVAGFMAAAGADSAGRSLFVMGSLLVGIFVVAILASGALLLAQARASAAEAQQKTSFVANVSHEFKTPLTTIRLYAELLAQGRVKETDKQAEYLHTIGSETQRLARLVNNVLDFSRLEQGRKKYALEELDLTAELGGLLDVHEPRIAGAGLVLRRALPAAPLPVRTDRDAFAQMVLNVVENACKYAAAGGEVEVSLAARAGGGAVVRVLDRGPGVPAAHRERIFEKFHRVDATITAEKTGAGLGLSIARQLARGLGGDLHHEPRPGGGAVFILELP